MSKVDATSARLRNARILMVGSGPSARRLPEQKRAGWDFYLTVNAGPTLFYEHRCVPDYLWVQDPRVFIEKQNLLHLDHFPEMKLLIAEHVAVPAQYHRRVDQWFRLLGNEGFSTDPRIGVFSGYSAVTGALQYVAWTRPAEIGLIGVDMNYSPTSTRFYQGSRGADVDLHVQDRQIKEFKLGIEAVERAGIRVSNMSDQIMLNRSVLV